MGRVDRGECASLAVHESVYEGKFQSPKTQRALRTIPLGRMPSKRWSRIVTGWRGKGPDDLVFGNRKGGPFRETKVLTVGCYSRQRRRPGSDE